MIVWTIQPWSVWVQLKTHGFANTKIENSMMLDLQHKFDSFPNDNNQRAYDWMVKQMKERIGNPPVGVEYPYWCWYKWDGEHKLKVKDFRSFDDQAVIELDIPSSELLLSDFDAWHHPLNNWFLPSDLDHEEIYEPEEAEFEKNPTQARKEKSWQNLFDISNSDYVQGCFWQLKYGQVRRVYHQKKNHRLKIIIPKRKVFSLG
ncbi:MULTISPECIES: DUF3841 domain-containing protein [Lactobacillus]|uniref:DUF3841 domain-containing protein n=1 Tax=Lactobacillus TaxID=1578 RepID=UPI000CD8A132|nr:MULTISPECIES: DUF3841 domain-containing protein [Lactobacillus]RVU73118.1 DUF3841 domain-containing protein [Lactobacillus xujianguonis]